MSYILMISHGQGLHYVNSVRNPIKSLLTAEKLAKSQARHLNNNKHPQAPKVKVTVLRKVSEYE